MFHTEWLIAAAAAASCSREEEEAEQLTATLGLIIHNIWKLKWFPRKKEVGWGQNKKKKLG